MSYRQKGMASARSPHFCLLWSAMIPKRFFCANYWHSFLEFQWFRRDLLLPTWFMLPATWIPWSLCFPNVCEITRSAFNLVHNAFCFRFFWAILWFPKIMGECFYRLESSFYLRFVKHISDLFWNALYVWQGSKSFWPHICILYLDCSRCTGGLTFLNEFICITININDLLSFLIP